MSNYSLCQHLDMQEGLAPMPDDELARLQRAANAGVVLAIQAKWALRMMRRAKLPARLCADFEDDINAFETAGKENPE